MRTQVESRNRIPAKIAISIIANIVVAAGFYLLFQILFHAASGTLTKTVFGSTPGSSLWNIGAIALSLPVPFHVISIGLILQKHWFSTRWVKVSWFAIIVSGSGLCVALFIKLFILK